jgi:SAM-dependent methyltransferase
VSAHSPADAPPTGAHAEFDAYAAGYDDALNKGLALAGESKEYFARERLRWLRRRLADRGVASGGSILDFGCGDGASTPFFFEELGVSRVVGADVSDGLLDVARCAYGADPRVEFRRIGASAPRGEFDLAFCNGVFHHIPVAERAAAARWVFDALRPGGLFAFWENNPWNPGTRLIMSRVSFDRDAITLTPPESRALLRTAGFEAAAIDYRFIFPRMLAWLRPLESLLARLPLGGQYLVLGVKR